MRNGFANDISADIKLRNIQISKIIQLSGSFGSWLANLGKKALANVDIPLAGDNLPGLVSNLTSSAINKFVKKIGGSGDVRTGTGFTLSRIKDGAYVINLDDKNSKRTHWVSLFIHKNEAIYFDSFEIKHIP